MTTDGYPHRATRRPATQQRPGRMAHEDWSNVSSSKTTPGLRERHSRRCASRQGAKCNCKPTWEAFVFDKTTGRKLRHCAKTKTEAKLWRQDALVASRRGELRAPRVGERRSATPWSSWSPACKTAPYSTARGAGIAQAQSATMRPTSARGWRPRSASCACRSYAVPTSSD